uniref:Focal adhesion kinase N-terminal domain-containing protein n=1 Tax=Labrus bergylta TaxID=56723 RepID=A0A3Q3GCE5_9LABR
MASSSYLEPNHNHSATGGCGVKSRSGMPGLERPPGSMDRVLKIFHYFETNSEPCTWASNIRHGDATDVRVRHTSVSQLLAFHAPISLILTVFPCWIYRVLSRR